MVDFAAHAIDMEVGARGARAKLRKACHELSSAMDGDNVVKEETRGRLTNSTAIASSLAWGKWLPPDLQRRSSMIQNIDHRAITISQLVSLAGLLNVILENNEVVDIESEDQFGISWRMLSMQHVRNVFMKTFTEPFQCSYGAYLTLDRHL